MSRKILEGSALLSPVPPALVTCGTLEKPNILTVAWTGVINSKPPKTYVSIRPERYSHELIEQSGELVINLSTADLVRAVDFCGVRSGRTTDKFSECNLHAVASSAVSAPTLEESPLSLECKVFDKIHFESHDLFLLDVVAVSVKDELFDENGRMALEKCGLLAYAHGEYYLLGKKLGSFGFSVKKRKKDPSKMAYPMPTRPHRSSAKK